MGNLTGKRIDLTFDGLLKTNDELPINGTLKTLQDGVGNDLPIQVSTTDVNFTGNVTGDNNTTYSLDTLQAIDQIEINLNGVNPSTQSTLIITAGTNITLTDDGNAGFIIDASVPVSGVTTLNTLDGALLLIAGGNITITDNGVDEITINAIDTNTTYDFSSAQNAANVELSLAGSDATTDTVTLVAGTNITLTEAGGNVTIDAAGGAQIYKPERKFSTAGDNTWNFAQPQNGNNYANGGFQELIDVSINRRFFTELWTSSISEVAVLVDPALFDGQLQVEIFTAWDETGMPKDLVASSSISITTGVGSLNWYTMLFGPSIQVDYAHYYVAIKAVSGTIFNGIYAAVNPSADISRLVEFDVSLSPPNPSDAVSYVGGMYDASNTTGNYALNYPFAYRIDVFPNIMFKS